MPFVDYSPAGGIIYYIICLGRAKSLQPCLTLSDPMGCSPPCSSVHGIFQARILECVLISSSRGSSQGLNPCPLGLLHWQVGSLAWPQSGKPLLRTVPVIPYEVDDQKHFRHVKMGYFIMYSCHYVWLSTSYQEDMSRGIAHCLAYNFGDLWF